MKGTEILLKKVTSDFLVYFADKSSTFTGVNNLVSLRRLIETHISEQHTKQSNMGTYKLKRCSKKKCCKQCRHAKFKCAMTNGPYKSKHTEQNKNTQNTKTQQTLRINYFCVFLFFMSDMRN